MADDQETANKMDALMQQLLAPSMEEIPASNVEPEQETKGVHMFDNSCQWLLPILTPGLLF